MASARVEEILADIVDGSPTAREAPQALVMACSRALEVTGVGLILMTDAGPSGTVAASDGPAATMEELQFTLGEGPCVDCSQMGRPVLQPDLGQTGPGRWPGFSAGALEAGISAIFAFPLRVGGIRLGVLDLYRDTPGELSEAQLTEALAFADAGTALLLHLQAQQSEDGLGPGAIPVIQDRAEVHQATGIISVQADVSMAESLVRLRARAYSSSQPILQVAQDVLCGEVSFHGEYHERYDGR